MYIVFTPCMGLEAYHPASLFVNEKRSLTSVPTLALYVLSTLAARQPPRISQFSCVVRLSHVNLRLSRELLKSAIRNYLFSFS